MASVSAALRDSPALLDPPAEPPPGRSNTDEIASFHVVGRILLRAGIRSGRREPVAAAAEIFREATEAAPIDPSLHNGLGASLLALARFERHANALSLLDKAAKEFQTAAATSGDQATPRSAYLRYSVNLATTQWMRGERIGDRELIRCAAETLRSVASELQPSSAYWSHVQDNLGNALAALGHTEEAMIVFEMALSGQQAASEHARSLNNLGAAHAESGRYADASRCYREALLLLSRDQFPLAWGLAQHNLGSVLLQTALSSEQPEREDRSLEAAVMAFRAALEVRLHSRTPLDWAVTTVNMAGALLSLGAYLSATNDQSKRRVGRGHVREAVSLYHAALPEVVETDLKRTLSNLIVALRVLRKLSGDRETEEEIRMRRADLLLLATRHGLDDMANEISSLTEDPTLARLQLAASLDWPTEIYSRAHKERNENIVQFLTRVWLPLIQAGAVDLRTLRSRDPSAAKAIENFRQRRDPHTGLRCKLPPPLDIPTKREVNDRMAAAIPLAGDRPARLDWALRSRARRAKKKI
jgi:tetratricopeptide (TPR) repeat protein